MPAGQEQDELRDLRDAVARLLIDLEKIACIADDAERGREFRRAWRAQAPLLPVPRQPRRK